MPTVRVVGESTASPDAVLEAARDFTERRAELWRDVHFEHITIHDRGTTWADVTEGNRWGPWLVWERLRYDWSQPDSVRAAVVQSNLFAPGSTWEIHARPKDGGSEVEIVAERRLKGLGLLIWPLFPTGLARRDVAAYLRQFLKHVEAGTHQRE